MGEVGRQLCAETGVNWMDFSGNASIEARGLRIHIQGHPNQFKRRGRPGSLFAPKSSRIAHWLLLHPERALVQRELTQAVGMGEGFVSRIVRGLVEQALVVGAIPRDAIAQFLFPREDGRCLVFSLDGHPHLRAVRIAPPEVQSYGALLGGGR